jgi:tetratricopeptide (TPR) repeat protein
MKTYATGEPDKYPLFVNRRVFQGSSGRVYPIPFVDSIATEGEPRQWQAIHLENQWIRLMILPELGGRIHVGYDKVAGYDFFYRNNVIKPALVGLAGPWISGGVEFNWPQHHRPATFLPTQTEIEQHDDGSITVWCSDHDPFARMRGTHGIRIYPDRAVVEVVGRLHNRTDQAQTFLWWANVAAAVDDTYDYQAFFPTDVHYVADHAERAITAFPASDRPYYGYDYPAQHVEGDPHSGDRLDFYKNVKVPTSYMITSTRDDFFGGYNHQIGAGFVHVADRHIAPGKKQWTWGNAPFGYAWDRLLTDNDGPYIELMAGVYTDNQPDFTWLEPGETKTFTQTWFPIQTIGIVHQSTTDAAVHLDVDGGQVSVGVAVSRPFPSATIRVTSGPQILHEQPVDLAPGQPWTWETTVDAETQPTDVTVAVTHDGAEIITWTPRAAVDTPEPPVAKVPPQPQNITSVDELWLTGTHLQQYRHPSRSPLPYWEEGLRRDPGDIRCNLALATNRYQRGLYPQAEQHLTTALNRLTIYNSNPRDGEVSYLLGLTLLRLGRTDQAVDALAKAAWDRQWLAPASLERGRIAARVGQWAEAARHATAAVAAAGDDIRAKALSVVALRQTGDDAAACEILDAALAVDPLDVTLRVLSDGLPALTGLDARTAIDAAIDLAQAGASALALDVLAVAACTSPTPTGEARPMAHYHRALILDRLGDGDGAAVARLEAQQTPDTRCFPAGLDDHDALAAALAADGHNRQAKRLLAMLLFDADRQTEALDLWESAIADGETDTVALRNAAIARYTVTADVSGALNLYEQALAAAPDARLIHEYDQLCSRAGHTASARVSIMDRYRTLILQRDDATANYINLLIDTGRLEEANELMTTRTFAPFEGGEGVVLATWERLHVARSQAYQANGDLPGALAAARAAIAVPHHLGEDRHDLADTTVISTQLAQVLEQLGRDDEAEAARAAIRTDAVVQAVLDDGSVDYFATSLPDLLLFPPLD